MQNPKWLHMHFNIFEPGWKHHCNVYISNKSRYGQRRCLEAWHMNRDDGSYLPQEYLHLVGK